MAMKTEPTEAMVKTDFGSLSGPTSLGGIGYNNYCGQRYSPHQAVLSPYSHYNAFQNTVFKGKTYLLFLGSSRVPVGGPPGGPPAVTETL